MERFHIIGKAEINEIEIEKQVNEILNILKTKKQTYAVNKFVLEKTIEELDETIID